MDDIDNPLKEKFQDAINELDKYMNMWEELKDIFKDTDILNYEMMNQIEKERGIK